MPVNINLLPDEVIAKGVTPANVGALPDAYWQGQDQAQKQALQNLYAGGLPRDPNDPTGKTIDWNKALEMLAQTQGAGAIPSIAALRSADIQQQAVTAAGKLGPIFNPAGLPSARPQVQMPPSTGRPPAQSQSYLEPDTGDRTLRPDQSGNIGGPIIGMSVDGKSVEPPALSLAAAQPDAGYPDRFRQLDNVPAGPPTEQFTPYQPPQPTQVAQAQPRQAPQDMPPRPAGSAAAPGSPEFNTPENAAYIRQMANWAQQAALYFGTLGQPYAGAAARLGAQSQQYFDTAKQIQDALNQREAPTDQIKAYQLGRLPGETLPQYQARTASGEEQAKGLATQFVEKYKNIQESGTKAETTIPQLQVVQRSTYDPNFYTGFARDRVLLARQVIGAMGGDPNTVAPMQVSDGLISGSMLSGLKAIVQGTGQVRSAELGLIRNTAASAADSPDAFRTKVEVALRVQQRARDIADMAQNYKGGNLDAGFDRQVSQLLPIFTKEEIANPKLLAYKQFKTPKEAADSGLPPNSVFRDSNNTFRRIP